MLRMCRWTSISVSTFSHGTSLTDSLTPALITQLWLVYLSSALRNLWGIMWPRLCYIMWNLHTYYLLYQNNIVTSRAGREPWENSTRPLEWLLRSVTCALHRSRISHGGATTVKDERGPGLDFMLCFYYVCVGGSRPWGTAAILLSFCIYFVLK